MERTAKTLLAGVVVAALGLPLAASADAPTVSITAPDSTNTVYLPAFPGTVPVTFTVGHSPVSSLKQLKVEDNVGVIFDVNSNNAGNPFTNNNCDVLTNSAAPPVTACSVALDTASANVAFDWSVAGPGTYTLTVTAVHGNSTGTDSDEYDIQKTEVISVEYPAPPAVANAYINASPALKALKGKVRGCIISAIAELHAKESAYGPKGGPYNISDDSQWPGLEVIHDNVDAFASACSS